MVNSGKERSKGERHVAEILYKKSDVHSDRIYFSSGAGRIEHNLCWSVSGFIMSGGHIHIGFLPPIPFIVTAPVTYCFQQSGETLCVSEVLYIELRLLLRIALYPH